VPLNITWPQALAWRLERQFLAPVGNESVEEVVRRLIGVQAQVASSAELAVRLRQRESESGAVAKALAEGRLIKTWAMRGTLHLLTPEEGGAALSLIAAGKPWHRPSWQRYFGLDVAQMDRLRDVIRATLDGQVLTREELIVELVKDRRLAHVAEGLRSGWGTLLKPAAWQGALVFGPNRGTRVTFTSPESASARWAGVPDEEEAAPLVVDRYLSAYGPATLDNFRAWMTRPSATQLRRWFGRANAVEVDVDGRIAYVREADVDDLAKPRPANTVRLLGGFDQWVLGPGTGDKALIAAERRTAVSKQSGWIAPIVVVGGLVRGTWGLEKNLVKVAWFRESGKPPVSAIREEVGRLGVVVGRDLELEVTST
jgi:hypothetical protein